ncbi:hypothetical protein [Actinacidiphila soli]|uniref:hypothetical protein n=1 Tax=Actinacidiphila soli TaxID=2487275 RepID=UPI000FCA3E2E|nr:hypothetical protein [Actinacidiphila soli]
MDEIVFRYTQAQRRSVRISVALLGLMSLAAAGLACVSVARDGVAEALGTWAVLGLAPLFLGLLGAGMASSGCTIVDDEGIRARSMWRHWQCSWAEIGDIAVAQEHGRGNVIRRIRVTLVTGGKFKLPAPYDSARLGADPNFDLKLEQICRRWRAGRKLGSKRP